jgi:hypothetical protein
LYPVEEKGGEVYVNISEGDLKQVTA